MAEAYHSAKQYLAAGADAIFPEALESEEDFQHFRKEVDASSFSQYDGIWANTLLYGRTI